MGEFRREERYVVFKKTDIDKYLCSGCQRRLKKFVDFIESERVKDGKEQLECVVVESDWPEYEPVWEMIQSRVEGDAALRTHEAKENKDIKELFKNMQSEEVQDEMDKR